VEEQRALSEEHEARVRVRRIEDRIALEKRRAKRRLERAQDKAARSEDAYKKVKISLKCALVDLVLFCM
jgi:hypothetical protein